jgi:hypothetical protein
MSPVQGSNASFLDALGAARAAIDTGVRTFAVAAQTVADAGTRGALPASGLVAGVEARNEVAAAARVFGTADQMLGTLLDLRA